jgi:hypothetical protein
MSAPESRSDNLPGFDRIYEVRALVAGHRQPDHRAEGDPAEMPAARR